MENIYAKRVEKIRSIMRKKGWDAVIISGSDPHSSEYMAPRWHQVEWVSGYSGEGEIVITLDHAGLWTDTRYFIQAAKQLPGTGIELHKTRVPDQVLIPEWLANVAFPSTNDKLVAVAVDGDCQAISDVNDIIDAFKASGREEYKIVNAPEMLSELWEDRPDIPQTSIITLGDEQVGWSRIQKISWLRKFLMEKECDAILLTALDEIAWTLNVRGSDIDYNPVVMSYLLVSMDEVNWYVKKRAIPKSDQETIDSFYELKADGVNIRDYSDIAIELASLSDEDGDRKLFADPSTLNYNLYNILMGNPSASVMTGKSPVALRKSIKNSVEIAGMKEAHYEDGLAMEKFLHWLETTVNSGAIISEYDAAVKLGEFRSQIPGYRGDSFETVSAWGEGAALPHYITPKDGSTTIGNHGLYLNDSGGQYLFGTTDITRTVALGPCTHLEKEDYTIVLKGHIGLAMAVFPKGTAGCQIDVLAREPMWKTFRNFGHGTGHGIGFYLNVHEGPQDIRQNFNRQAIVPGMITSNEPRIYREGLHGVRHESLVLCVEADKNEFGEFLKFETLTLCHIDTAPIIKELLNDEEKTWLNEYNERVYRELSPRLPIEVAQWLRKKTLPI
ncbi:MAG: aminopeptidase P family protein [Bacteroidales bacterium]|nr:aminopeptidase P family protein [Bacteroidales bacterium]